MGCVPSADNDLKILLGGQSVDDEVRFLQWLNPGMVQRMSYTDLMKIYGVSREAVAIFRLRMTPLSSRDCTKECGNYFNPQRSSPAIQGISRSQTVPVHVPRPGVRHYRRAQTAPARTPFEGLTRSQGLSSSS